MTKKVSNEPELQLPNIPIKITRENDKLKFKAGDFTLTLKQISGAGEQTYPLLVLDKFITEITTVLLKKEIEKQEQREAVRKSLAGQVDDATAIDNVVRQIHEDLFPGQ